MSTNSMPLSQNAVNTECAGDSHDNGTATMHTSNVERTSMTSQDQSFQGNAFGGTSSDEASRNQQQQEQQQGDNNPVELAQNPRTENFRDEHSYGSMSSTSSAAPLTDGTGDIDNATYVVHDNDDNNSNENRIGVTIGGEGGVLEDENRREADNNSTNDNNIHGDQNVVIHSDAQAKPIAMLDEEEGSMVSQGIVLHAVLDDEQESIPILHADPVPLNPAAAPSEAGGTDRNVTTRAGPALANNRTATNFPPHDTQRVYLDAGLQPFHSNTAAVPSSRSSVGSSRTGQQHHQGSCVSFWKGRRTSFTILGFVVMAAVAIAVGVAFFQISTRKNPGGESDTADDSFPDDVDGLPVAWFVQDLGYPDPEGTTYPWVSLSSRTTCLQYCKGVSALGTLAAVAFVKSSQDEGLPSGVMESGDCYCYENLQCMLRGDDSVRGNVIAITKELEPCNGANPSVAPTPFV